MARKSSPSKIIRNIELYQVFLLTLGYLFTALYSIGHGHKKSENFKIDNDDYLLEIKLSVKK